jgi:hypothetical protein
MVFVGVAMVLCDMIRLKILSIFCFFILPSLVLQWRIASEDQYVVKMLHTDAYLLILVVVLPEKDHATCSSND